MIKTDRAVIVEGRYDKIKLTNILDAQIIETGGFSIFNDGEKRAFIKRLAETKGIIIITDSDAAGFKIRNYIKNFSKNGDIINVYIPDILGKEKRKNTYSKERKLGVEGMDDSVLLEAFKKAGITADSSAPDENRRLITKTDLYLDGFNGTDNSCEKRRKLLTLLSLPKRLSSSAMLDALNSFYTFEQYKQAVTAVEKGDDFNEI